MTDIRIDYVNHMGSDLSVCDAARVSFNKDSSNYTLDQNHKLIKYLANHNHFTPFTHCMISLREKVPIFVARQRFKHMVGFTYNEVSRRYVDDTPEFYMPDVWRSRPEGSVKQGSGEGSVENIIMRNDVESWESPIDNAYDLFLDCAENLYNSMLEAGVAPEQARMVLPQSMMTEYIVTGSLFAFARAYKLRADSHSQKEIQYVSADWDSIIRPLYPLSWSALVD